MQGAGSFLSIYCFHSVMLLESPVAVTTNCDFYFINFFYCYAGGFILFFKSKYDLVSPDVSLLADIFALYSTGTISKELHH
jgi:hypothetical protein